MLRRHRCTLQFCFFFNDTATTEIYTLSLHDALPIYLPGAEGADVLAGHRDLPLVRRLLLVEQAEERGLPRARGDRKSTRLNSSHANISYAVFCLKKKNVSAD